MALSTDQRKDSPDQPSLPYLEMAEDWQRIEDLRGGTRAMRAGPYLPKVRNEKDAEYQARLSRAFLTEMYADTVSDLVAMPFRQLVQVADLPPKLAYLETDVDGRGTSLTSFAAGMLTDMIDYGLTHGFVDFTPVPENVTGQRPASIAAEAQVGARPIFQRWKPSAVIAWRLNDADRPEIVRIKETAYRPKDGAVFLDEAVRLVRQWTPDEYTSFRMIDSVPRGEVDYVEEESVPIRVRGQSAAAAFGGLPHVVAYANQTGPFQATPALRALAEVNIAHFQTDGDMRNALRVAAFAMLMVKGWKKSIADEVDDPEAGEFPSPAPTNVYTFEDPDADMKFVEHTGAAIDASRETLKDLENRGERLGAQPVAREAAAKTATGANIDETRNMSQLEAWVRELESALRQMFEFAATWVGITLPESFAVRIFDEFSTEDRSPDSLALLTSLWEKHAYPTRELLAKLQRAGHLPDSVDVDALAAEIDADREARSEVMRDTIQDPAFDQAKDPAGAAAA